MIVVQNISKDDLDAWKAAPVTRQVFKAIADRLDEIERNLGRGRYLDHDNPYRTQSKTSQASGMCKALKDVLGMTEDQ